MLRSSLTAGCPKQPPEMTMPSIAMSDSPSLPSVSRRQLVIEHIRIDPEKPYLETRTALEKLPRSDERIRSHFAAWRHRTRQS